MFSRRLISTADLSNLLSISLGEPASSEAAAATDRCAPHWEAAGSVRQLLRTEAERGTKVSQEAKEAAADNSGVLDCVDGGV